MRLEKILLVDDEVSIVEFVKINLERAGYEVIAAYDGNEAIQLAKRERPALIILDIMLPGLDGFEVLREIRKFSNVPVIMLTAKGEDIDKILGLELGADDYLTKPFNPRELTARVKAILRRIDKQNEGREEAGRIVIADLDLDLNRREVFVRGKPVELTPKEFDLLEFLSSNPGKVYSRETLLRELWGYDYYGDSKTVDVHIRRLREKIEEEPSKPKYILTVWGVGYKFGEQK
ncbi:MAG TPA: response regulator transcription factor [Clostridia bacterium]|nr:response regulator transcription factor [Clostridia bacterium]